MLYIVSKPHYVENFGISFSSLLTCLLYDIWNIYFIFKPGMHQPCAHACGWCMLYITIAVELQLGIETGLG